MTNEEDGDNESRTVNVHVGSEHIFLSLCALAPPYGQRDKEVVQRSLGEEDTRARWILGRRCDGDASFDALALSQNRLYNHSWLLKINPYKSKLPICKQWFQ